jgi:hypothetical protein
MKWRGGRLAAAAMLNPFAFAKRAGHFRRRKDAAQSVGVAVGLISSHRTGQRARSLCCALPLLRWPQAKLEQSARINTVPGNHPQSHSLARTTAHTKTLMASTDDHTESSVRHPSMTGSGPGVGNVDYQGERRPL